MALTPPGPGLGFMQRLSPSVTYFIPPNVASNASTTDPDLILLLSWMGAREEHIAKYVHHHHALFPTSRILVAQCPLSHVYFPPYVYFHARPVVPILKELVDATSTSISTKPRLLLHAFSNGGVSTAIQIYSQLKRQLGGKFTLPRHVFIFDSCPGYFRWKSTARAIMKKLPGWMAPFIHSFLFSIWLMYKLPLLQPAQNRNARLIRNPNLKSKEVRRAYLYGSEDDLIYPSDVEEQAQLAIADGFDVRLERFEGAMHCAIAKTEPDRYWQAVKETWYGTDALAETVLIEKEAEDVQSVEEDEVAEDEVDEVTLAESEELNKDVESVGDAGEESTDQAVVEKEIDDKEVDEKEVDEKGVDEKEAVQA